MKMSIDWHEECLKNMNTTLNTEKVSLERLLKDIDRLENRINFYSCQIEEAKRKKKDGFDSDKFLKIRKEK